MKKLHNHKYFHEFLFFFQECYKPYKRYALFLIIFSVILGFNGFINSYLIKIIIDALVNLENPKMLLDAVFWPALFTFLHMEIYNISWRAIDYVRLKSVPLIKSNIITHAFDYIHGQSMDFFTQSPSGVVTNNIHILSENIDLISKAVFIRLTRAITQIIIAFVSMYFIHPYFAAILIFWTCVFIGISFKFSRKILSVAGHYAKSQSQLSGILTDSICNFANVKLFAQAQTELRNLGLALSKLQESYRSKEWFLIKLHYVQGLSITILVGFMIYTLLYLRINNQVTIGDFAFILSLSLYVVECVWSLTEYVDQINDSVGMCKQALKAIYTPVTIKDLKNAKPLVVKDGKIIFDKVHFQYNDAISLFHDLSVSIEPKQKIGLVGYSGAGKSTFINLLLRLYDTNSGNILIDGQNIQNITQDSLRKSISLIPQDPFLFHRSIMENIRYGNPDASDNEVISATKKAQIHEFINSLPQKYSTLVGDRGIKLSGGQRQSIALARVILKNSPILILDEATSQLDSLTEFAIQEVLTEFANDKTTIVIAHRLSTLLKMDRILVFDKGMIVGEGTHQELLKSCTLYSKLWNTQTGNIIPNE